MAAAKRRSRRKAEVEVVEQAPMVTPLAEADAEVEATLVATTPLDPAQWVFGLWRDREQLRCLTCGWDTLKGEPAAQERVRGCSRCGPKSPPRARVSEVLTADRYGRETPTIIIEEGDDDDISD